MPRKIKTIPLETIVVKDDESEHDEEVKVDSYEAVINLIQDESQTENEDVMPPPPPPVKVKKARAPKKKKDLDPPIVVSENEDEDVQLIETTIIVDEPVVEEDKKKDDNIKVVELLQCEKCGKKLTARTLKYSHNAVCPANENKTPPKSKRVKPNDEVKEEVKTPEKVERIKRRQEKFNNLFSNAV